MGMETIKTLIQSYADHQDTLSLEVTAEAVKTVVIEDMVRELQTFVCQYLELKQDKSPSKN